MVRSWFVQYGSNVLGTGIPKGAQREVFRPVPHGVHKIVLSTNIAETSVTIDNVTVVIDTGRVKEKSYDPHTKLSCLKAGWISQVGSARRVNNCAMVEIACVVIHSVVIGPVLCGLCSPPRGRGKEGLGEHEQVWIWRETP